MSFFGEKQFIFPAVSENYELDRTERIISWALGFLEPEIGEKEEKCICDK